MEIEYDDTECEESHSFNNDTDGEEQQKEQQKEERKQNLNNMLNKTIYEPWFDLANIKELRVRDNVKALYNEKNVKYYDLNLQSQNESIKDITNSIMETDNKFQTYCKKCAFNNRKPQSYSIYHFIHKNSLIFKTKELEIILSEIFPNDIIKEIALYSNHIYARGVRGGNIHFSYHSIIPTKHMYDNLKFRKTNNVNFKKEIGEIVFIFEKYHPNNLYISEGIYCDFDVVLYYEKFDLYSIFSIYTDQDSYYPQCNDIELINFEFHTSLLKK